MGIIYIDKTKSPFFCQDSKCTPLEHKIKHETIVASIDPQKVITHSFKVPTSIQEDELDVEVEMKLFDEAGLNPNEEYQFSYIKKELNVEETENLVEAFAVKVGDLQSGFADLAKAYGHIDILTIPYIGFEGLYDKRLLEPKNDVFVHLGRESSYIVLCQDGKYIYARNINSLNKLVQGFDPSLGMDTDSYIELLRAKGLEEGRYGSEEGDLFDTVQSQFQAIYHRINDTVMYNRNIFGFDAADRIFIDCEDGWIHEIDSFIHEDMLEKAQVLSLKENLHFENNQLPAVDCITAQYALLHAQVRPNLTIFERKVPLYKTFMAKLLYTAAAAAVLAGTYPAYLWYENRSIETAIEGKEAMLKQKQKRQIALASKLKSAQQEQSALQERLQQLQKKRDALQAKIQDVLTLDQNNREDMRFFATATELLEKYDLHSMQMSKTEQEYELGIYTSLQKRDLVTMLMEDLIDAGYEGVRTEKIDSSSGQYESVIKIK